MKKIDFMLTALRDGLQSVYGARVHSSAYIPIAKEALSAGIEHFECFGGAIFQNQVFNCNENPFTAIDEFRKAVGPHANLQSLSRGVNLLTLDGQSKSAIELHAHLCKKHALTTIRNFDALNDPENLMYSAQCIVNEGLKHELAIAMMDLPSEHDGVHSEAFYLSILKNFIDSGIPFDSICFKDASGTVRPKKTYNVIKGARKLLGDNVKIVFHTHDTAGIGISSYLAAIEAGANQIDLSMAPVSGGASQSDIITMWHALRDSNYTLDIDIQKIIKLEEFAKDALNEYECASESTRVEPLMPFFPLPGGALAINIQLLKEAGLEDRYLEVVRSMGNVVAKAGFANAGTPVSHYYFQQAFNNVLYGDWQRIAEGYGKLVLGYYGKTPLPADEEIVNIAKAKLALPLAHDTQLERANADSAKSTASIRQKLSNANIDSSDENIFVVAMCQDKGMDFLQGKGRENLALKKEHLVNASSAKGKENLSTNKVKDLSECTVTIAGTAYGVKLSSDGAIVNGVNYRYSIVDGIDEEAIAKNDEIASNDESEIALSECYYSKSPLSGIVTAIYKKPGDKVAIGETVCVIKAMNTDLPVNSMYSGIISEILIELGTSVDLGLSLFKVNVYSHAKGSGISRALEAETGKDEKTQASKTRLVSPIPGLVLRLNKEVGQKVQVGETILVLESMKMENPVNSTVEGVISSITVKRGDAVKRGEVISIIDIEGGLK